MSGSHPSSGLSSIRARTVAAWSRLLALGILGPVALWSSCAVLFVAHALAYHPFFADDGFISLRYAERLSQGHGLTWSDGERVEGYSNLLWVLGCALLGALRIDLVLAARLLGVASALAAMTALYRGALSRTDERRPWLAMAAGSLVLVTSGPLAVWSIGGLEQPLVAALLAWSLVGGFPLLTRVRVSWRQAVPCAIPLGLLAWTRPDGVLLGTAIALGLVVIRQTQPIAPPSPEQRRSLWPIAEPAVGIGAIVAAFALAQLAFRLAYYGEWVPNPALAKLAVNQDRLSEGLKYVSGALSIHTPLLVLLALVVFPIALDRQARRRVLLVAFPLAAWLAYVAVIGGDIFPARRHIVPAVLLLAFLIAEGVGWAVRGGYRLRFAATAGAVLALGLSLVNQLADPENRRAVRERWEWDGAVVGNLLHKHFGDRHPLLAADSAGTLPYFSKLPAIDLLGLNDRTIAKTPPADLGHGPLGHELGNGAYVLARKPDLVIFGLPTGEEHALYRSGKEMQHDRRFALDYQLISFESEGDHTVRSRIWVRREGTVGFRAGEDRVEVPGYLFASSPQVVAREDADGRLGAVLAPGGSGKVRRVRFTPGTWKLNAEYLGPAPTVTLAHGEFPAASGTPPLMFVVPGPGPLVADMGVETSGSALTHLRSVTIERARPGADSQDTTPEPSIR